MKASCCDQFARCRRVMEASLCAAVRLFGFDWSRISEVLGVSANACKKRWSSFRSSYLPLSHLLHPLPPVASFPVVGGSFPLVVPLFFPLLALLFFPLFGNEHTFPTDITCAHCMVTRSVICVSILQS